MITINTNTINEVDMNNALEYQEKLADQHKYRKLDPELSKEVKAFYLDCLPENLKLEGSAHAKICSENGILIATGYSRVVIGDYGAFIEIPKHMLLLDSIMCMPGQEFRIDNPRYKDSVKFAWLTTAKQDVKIYEQKRTVTYADYKVGFFYVSPHEVTVC